MKFRNEYPSFSSILEATNNGNIDAIKQILYHYDPYVSKCSLRPLFDEYNNVHISIDTELKSLITTALIGMILKFEVDVV